MAEKQQIIKDYQAHATDTGSTEVQVAILTDRIAHLTEHLKVHKGDHQHPPWTDEAQSANDAVCSTTCSAEMSSAIAL